MASSRTWSDTPLSSDSEAIYGSGVGTGSSITADSSSMSAVGSGFNSPGGMAEGMICAVWTVAKEDPQ